MSRQPITNVRRSPASSRDVSKGVHGWVRFEYGSLRIDGVALRVRRIDGSRYLQFPWRPDGEGRRHALVRPLDQSARDEIEAEVLGALGLEAKP